MHATSRSERDRVSAPFRASKRTWRAEGHAHDRRRRRGRPGLSRRPRVRGRGGVRGPVDAARARRLQGSSSRRARGPRRADSRRGRRCRGRSGDGGRDRRARNRRRDASRDAARPQISCAPPGACRRSSSSTHSALPGLDVPQRAYIRGDRRVAAIAAASIVAKAARDARMDELERRFPVYGFAIAPGVRDTRAPLGAPAPRPEPRSIASRSIAS